MDKIIKALIGLIFAFIALVGIFGILPQLGLESPFANFHRLSSCFLNVTQ